MLFIKTLIRIIFGINLFKEEKKIKKCCANCYNSDIGDLDEEMQCVLFLESVTKNFCCEYWAENSSKTFWEGQPYEYRKKK